MNEHAEAAALDLLNLRAHQLVAHLLGQSDAGLEPIAATLDALDDADPAEVFARSLGVLATLIDPDEAQRVRTAARAVIPGMMLRAEQGNP